MQPPPPPLPLPSRNSFDPYIEEQERQREERLARILQMERELAMLRSREGDVLNSKPVHHPPPPPPPAPMESHHDRDGYSRRSPGPTHSSIGSSSYQSSYSRDSRSNGLYGGDHLGADRNRGYYNHNSPPREYTTRSYASGGSSGGLTGGAGSSYRDPVSYPSQYGTNSTGGSGGYSSRSSAPSVGYGGSASASKAKTSLPPGWPPSDTKSMNRAPFSVGGGSWS